MESKIQIGLIGGGMYGGVHIQCVREEGRGEVRWVCTRTESSLRDIQYKYAIPKGTLSYHDILADPEVTAVIIATPPGSHAQIAIDALRAGKHVLLEKPMAVSKEESDAIVAEAASRPEQVVLECSCRHSRLQPKFAFVKGLIDTGKLGNVYHIHHHQLSPATFLDWNPKGTWALDKHQAGGGPVFDWGAYDFSFHLGLLGDVPRLLSVKSFAVNHLRQIKSDVEQHAAAFLEFDTGLTYYYERGAGVHGELPNETRIFGDRGGLRFSYLSWESNQVEYFYEDKHGKPQKELLRVDMDGNPGNDNLALIHHFMDCIQGKATPEMPVTLAAKHLDIMLRILAI
jgi:predicted dehydrogenase